MKKKSLVIALLLISLVCSLFIFTLKVEAEQLYEYENISYVDLGNVMGLEKDTEMSIVGDSSVADATDINTILSFGFIYKKEVPARQWFAFLTQNFQWLNNYSVTINNPINAETNALENAYIEFGYGSDAHTMCFGKYEADEHFEVGQKYVMDIGVVELFSDANYKTKVAERIKGIVYKVVDGEYVEMINASYDHEGYDETISPSTRGKSFYFYFNEGFNISTGKYYKEMPKYEGDLYTPQVKSTDFYQVLNVDANFRQIGSSYDYYISGSGSTNSFMSIGVTFSQVVYQRTFVAFNVQYGTSWNGNYSFCFSQNGNITLGYGSDFQSWGFFNFGTFEINRKYVFEYGSVELFSDNELTTKVGERIVVNVYKTTDEGTYELMGTASKDIIEEYYEYFPASKRGNCTFIHQIAGTSFSCGFYNRDYKGVIVVDKDYYVVDLSYGAKYDFSGFYHEKENYEFTGWYYLDSYNRKVFIPEKGVWNYDFSTINDGYYTCEIYANYEPLSYDINYVINNGVNNSLNLNKIVMDKKMPLLDPITSEGYIFKGWYVSSDFAGEKVTEVVGNKDITLYAKIVKASKVEFKYNDDIIETIYVDKEVSYQLPTEIGEVVVSCLEVEGNILNNSMIFATDTVVKVSGTYKDYNIIYHLDGGNNSSDNPAMINYFSEALLNNATKEGYLFGGWYTDKLCRNEVKSLNDVYDDINLYAKFYKICDVEEIEIEPNGDVPYYLPQLNTPSGSIVSIKLFDENNKEIELSNKINYYFSEEGTYKLVYHVDTLYGEYLDYNIIIKVVAEEDILPENPTDNNQNNDTIKDDSGCSGSIASSIISTLLLVGAFFVIKKRKEN